MRFEDVIILGNKPVYKQNDLCLVIIFPFEIHISKANPYLVHQPAIGPGSLLQANPYLVHQPAIGPGSLLGVSSPPITYEWMICPNLRTLKSSTPNIIALAGNEVASIEQAIQESELWICRALSLLGENIDKARKWRNVIEVHNS